MSDKPLKLKGRISYGRTENLGNYRSFKLTASLEFDLSDISLEEAAGNLTERLDKLISLKKAELFKLG